MKHEYQGLDDAKRRLAYGQNQFETFKLRAMLRFAAAQEATHSGQLVKAGMPEKLNAEQHLEIMQRHIDFLQEVNDANDSAISYIAKASYIAKITE